MTIYLKFKSTKKCQKDLQIILNKLSRWCDRTGFKISTQKTAAILFSKKRKTVDPPILTFKGEALRFTDTHKFVGMKFDKKLNWKAHIEEIKNKCSSQLRILKFLASTRWGASREVLLRVFTATVLSRLEYGSMVYANATKSDLKLLDSIQNSGLRIITGAFRTTPSVSLCSEMGMMPLQNRRELSLAKKSIQILASPDSN